MPQTRKEIIDAMVSEMPYVLPDCFRPYIYEAMTIYADEAIDFVAENDYVAHAAKEMLK